MAVKLKGEISTFYDEEKMKRWIKIKREKISFNFVRILGKGKSKGKENPEVYLHIREPLICI